MALKLGVNPEARNESVYGKAADTVYFRCLLMKTTSGKEDSDKKM